VVNATFGVNLETFGVNLDTFGTVLTVVGDCLLVFEVEDISFSLSCKLTSVLLSSGLS